MGSHEVRNFVKWFAININILSFGLPKLIHNCLCVIYTSIAYEISPMHKSYSTSQPSRIRDEILIAVNVCGFVLVIGWCVQKNTRSKYTSIMQYVIYTGWPRKNATTLIINFKDIVNKTDLFLILLGRKVIFQQNYTMTINFGWGIWILGLFLAGLCRFPNLLSLLFRP